MRPRRRDRGYFLIFAVVLLFALLLLGTATVKRVTAMALLAQSEKTRAGCFWLAEAGVARMFSLPPDELAGTEMDFRLGAGRVRVSVSEPDRKRHPG